MKIITNCENKDCLFKLFLPFSKQLHGYNML